MQDNVLNSRYRLLEQIGQGSTSIVYKALDILLNRYVAVKILKEEFSKNEVFYEQFLKEAKAVASLQHINIIKIFDFGIDGRIYYIVMELFDSITLKEYIANQKIFLKNEEIVNIAYQIALGLQVAHKKNIIHRDIKSQNILITKDLEVKITDFGIARVPNDINDVEDGTIIDDGKSMGTVHYSSPEQLRSGFVDNKSDIYSYGIVLYELCTGRLPYDGNNSIGVALKHFNEEITLPSKINSNLNLTIEKIITYCIKRKPELRFESIDDIISVLEAIKQNSYKFVDFEIKKNYNDDLEYTINYEDEFKREIEDNIKNIEEVDDSIKFKVTEDVSRDELDMKKNKKESIFTFSNFITAILGILVGVIIVVILFYKPLNEAKMNKAFVLQDLSNMNFTEAGNELAKKGVFLEKIGEKYSKTLEPNSIISQDPKSGVLIKSGQTVSVIVSTTKNDLKVVVPNVTHKTVEEAKIILEKYKLNYEIIENQENILPKGTIISQSPNSNEEILEGDMVKLVVSLGLPEKVVIMPNLIGKTKSEVISILEKNNLKYSFEQIEDIQKENDTIIFQDISSGSEVKENTIIKLKVVNNDNLKNNDKNSDKLEENVNNLDKDKDVVDNNNENNNNNLSGKDDKLDNSTEIDSKVKTYYIPLNEERDLQEVKIVKIDNGKEVILYDKKHKKEEKRVVVNLKGNGKTYIRFYLDGELISEIEEDF